MRSSYRYQFIVNSMDVFANRVAFLILCLVRNPEGYRLTLYIPYIKIAKDSNVRNVCMFMGCSASNALTAITSNPPYDVCYPKDSNTCFLYNTFRETFTITVASLAEAINWANVILLGNFSVTVRKMLYIHSPRQLTEINRYQGSDT